MRGARTGSNPAPHLLAAPGRAAGTALTQRRVADKSNEIPALRDLLAPLDLGGAVAGADAMHTQTGTAEWIRSRGAHYVLTVKNMPAGPETGPGETALEGRALHLRPRRLPRAQSAAHRPGRRGPRPGRLPRRRPGDPDPPHQNRQQARRRQEDDHRGGPPDLLPPHDRRPARTGRLLGPRALGHREPPPLDPRRRLRRGPPPAAHPQRTLWSRPPCATSPSASSDSSTAPEPPSPPPPEPWQDAPNEPSDYSPNQPPKPTLPTPCHLTGRTPHQKT